MTRNDDRAKIRPDCPLCAMEERRIVYEGNYVRIAIPLGPLAPGHVILFSRNHLMNFWKAPVHMTRELGSVVERVDRVLGQTYGGGTVFFEHGVMKERAGLELHCAHAHRNVVPVEQGRTVLRALMPRLQAHGLRFMSVSDQPFGGKAPRGATDYYYVGDSKGAHVALVGPGMIAPRRLFRRAWAEALSQAPDSVTNWERHQRQTVIRGSRRQLGRGFREID